MTHSLTFRTVLQSKLLVLIAILALYEAATTMACPNVLQLYVSHRMCLRVYRLKLVYVPYHISEKARKKQNKKQTPWSESASELYRPSDRRFSAKWLPTFADKGYHVVSVTDPYGRILGFLDKNRYFSIK
jgi:hypothetical protein